MKVDRRHARDYYLRIALLLLEPLLYGREGVNAGGQVGQRELAGRTRKRGTREVGGLVDCRHFGIGKHRARRILYCATDIAAKSLRRERRGKSKQQHK